MQMKWYDVLVNGRVMYSGLDKKVAMAKAALYRGNAPHARIEFQISDERKTIKKVIK